MKYIVYLTINKENNKIYIGVHETENPEIFDGYLGCGAYANKPSSYNKGKTHLHNAILKYGVSSFFRKTLKVFDNLEDALNLEANLVTEEFIKRTDTYNSILEKETTPVTCKIGGVNQYSKDGILLNSFENASVAALKLDIKRQEIVNAVYNRTTCCGYYFLRSDEDINELLNNKKSKIYLNKTKVYRFTPSGVFDKEYNSIAEAITDTPKTSHGNIIRAIKNNRTCGGYKWSYEKELITNAPLKPVKVAQYDMNHNLVKIWDSVAKCKEEFPSCQKVCRKERKSTNNFIFEYIS